MGELLVIVPTYFVLGALIIAAKRLQVEMRERADALALSDPLTGVANRRAFEALMDMGRSGGRASDRVGLLLVDLDDFKSANTLFGHTGGDRVLCAAADALREAARGNDLVARLGGDEFAILATGISREATERLAQRVLDKVAAADRELDLTGFRLSASVGWATHPDPVERPRRSLPPRRHGPRRGQGRGQGGLAQRGPRTGPRRRRRSHHLAQPARLDLVDEAPHRVGVGDERALHDLPDRVADAVSRSRNAPLCHSGRWPVDCSSLSLNSSSVILSRPQSVWWISSDLLGAQQVLGDRQRADLVVGDHAAGVADHVGVALLQAQDLGGDHAGVHAGHDGHLLARRAGQAGLVEAGGVRLVVASVGRRCAHRASWIARELTYSGRGARTTRLHHAARSPTTPRWTPPSPRALMLRVASGDLPETLRIARPGPIVAFGKRDVVGPGLPRGRRRGARGRLRGHRAAGRGPGRRLPRADHLVRPLDPRRGPALAGHRALRHDLGPDGARVRLAGHRRPRGRGGGRVLPRRRQRERARRAQADGGRPAAGLARVARGRGGGRRRRRPRERRAGAGLPRARAGLAARGHRRGGRGGAGRDLAAGGGRHRGRVRGAVRPGPGRAGRRHAGAGALAGARAPVAAVRRSGRRGAEPAASTSSASDSSK